MVPLLVTAMQLFLGTCALNVGRWRWMFLSVPGCLACRCTPKSHRMSSEQHHLLVNNNGSWWDNYGQLPSKLAGFLPAYCGVIGSCSFRCHFLMVPRHVSKVLTSRSTQKAPWTNQHISHLKVDLNDVYMGVSMYSPRHLDHPQNKSFQCGRTHAPTELMVPLLNQHKWWGPTSIQHRFTVD